MRISFNPLAERELNDAAQYYELESPGLGAAFLNETERTCTRIIEYPEAAPVARGTVRRLLCAVLHTHCTACGRHKTGEVVALADSHLKSASWVPISWAPV